MHREVSYLIICILILVSVIVIYILSAIFDFETGPQNGVYTQDHSTLRLSRLASRQPAENEGVLLELFRNISGDVTYSHLKITRTASNNSKIQNKHNMNVADVIATLGKCTCSYSEKWSEPNLTLPEWRLFQCLPSSTLQVFNHSAELNYPASCPSNAGSDNPFPPADSIDPEPQAAASRPLCVRYIIADHDYSGLGHRAGVVAVTANLAAEFGFRLALGGGLRRAKAPHGDYPRFREMLGLAHLPYDDELRFPAGAEVLREVVRSREEFLERYLDRYRSECHLAVTAMLGRGDSCLRLDGSTIYCFYAFPGAFRRARRAIRRGGIRAAAAAALDDAPGFLRARERGELTVVWHLRCGDIVLRPLPDYFTGVRAAIAAAGVPLRDFVVRSNCSDFDFLREVLPSAEVVVGSVEQAMGHMAAADVLVHTGSSMSSAAALVARRPQLYFETTPKEGAGAPAETYALRAVSVDPAGRLSEGQPFRPSAAAALAAAAAGEDRASALLRQVARYVRAIRAASYPAGPGASGPEAAAEARELGDLLGYKVVSGALTDRTAAGLLAWERSAALADRVLPGWTVRVHYDSTRDGGPCRLRAMRWTWLRAHSLWSCGRTRRRSRATRSLRCLSGAGRGRRAPAGWSGWRSGKTAGGRRWRREGTVRTVPNAAPARRIGRAVARRGGAACGGCAGAGSGR